VAGSGCSFGWPSTHSLAVESRPQTDDDPVEDAMAIRKHEPPPLVEPADEADRRRNWREQGFVLGVLSFPEVLALTRPWGFEASAIAVLLVGYAVMVGLYGLITSGIIAAFEYSPRATRWTHASIVGAFTAFITFILLAH
jgi:hypothetical protein